MFQRTSSRCLTLALRSRHTAKCRKSTLASPSSSAAPGVAFDMDGVLIKGQSAIPGARRALERLRGDNSQNREFPFIVLTNSGGEKEEEKAHRLSKKLGLEISPSQFIVSHSPMRQLADVYRDKLVFIVGPPNCKNVAHAYGFKHVILSSEMREWDRSLWPFAVRDEHKHEKTQEDLSSRPISAVMIFHDSPDWGLDIQLITDVLMSQDGRITTRQDISSERPIVQSVPLYSSAADFLWSNEWQHPRFGQGGFVRALGGVWKELSGSDLKIDTQFGKPSAATYDYAKAVMTDFAGSIPPHVYMVGDNPASDIQGANINGWKSILVETGVYRPGVKLTEAQRPTTIVNDVASAVDWILKEEGCA